MKLKKIAALALAGVMAVSMLAGCASDKPATSEPTTEPTTNAAYTNELVEALKADETLKDVKNLTITADASLQTSLDKLAAVPGMEPINIGSFMVAADDSLKESVLPLVDGANTDKGNSYKTDSAKQVAFNTIFSWQNAETYVYASAVKDLVAQLKGKTFSGNKENTLANMTAASGTYTDADGSQYEFKFDYTLGVAVAPVQGVNNSTYYVVAYTLTRNATKTPVEA